MVESKEKSSAFNSKEKLPLEALLRIFRYLEPFDLSNALLIKPLKFAPNEIEKLRTVAKYDPDLNIIRMQRKRVNLLLGAQGDTIVDFNDYVISCLTTKEAFFPHGLSRIDTGLARDHEELPLLTHCFALKNLPLGEQHPYQLLKASIDSNNINLCSRILFEAKLTLSKIADILSEITRALSTAHEEKRVLQEKQSKWQIERNKWQDPYLSRLIEKAQLSERWQTLAWNCMKDLPCHTEIQCCFHGGFDRPLNLLHVALLKSDKIAELLLKKHYTENSLPKGSEKTIIILSLLAFTFRGSYRGQWYEAKRNELFDRFNKKPSDLLSYSKTWWQTERHLLIETFQTSSHVDIPVEFFSKGFLNKKCMGEVYLEAALEELSVLIKSQLNSFSAKRLVSSWMNCISKSPKFLQEQLCLSLLQGNIKRIRWLIETHQFEPSWTHLKKVLEILLDLKLTQKALKALDESWHAVLTQFATLKKDIPFKVLPRLLELGLPQTLQYIASLYNRENLLVYIAEKRNPPSQQEHTELCIENRRLLGLFYLHQYSSQEIKNYIKIKLTLELMRGDEQWLALVLDHEQLIKTSEVVEILLEDKMNPWEAEMAHCQLTAVNRWIKQNTPLKDQAKEQYVQYLTKLLNKLAAIDIAYNDETTTNYQAMIIRIRKLYCYIYKLFSFHQYPDLLYAIYRIDQSQSHIENKMVGDTIAIRRQDEVIKRLFSGIIDAINEILAIDRENLKEKHDGILNGDENNRRLKTLLMRYLDLSSHLEKNTTMVQIALAGSQVFCSLGRGLKLSVLLKDAFMHRRILRQVLSVEGSADLQQLLKEVYDAGYLLLSYYKHEPLLLLPREFEGIQDQLTLMQPSIEEIKEQEKHSHRRAPLPS